MLETINARAFLVGVATTLLLLVAIFIGSRNLQNFDAALVAYLFGSIFSCFAVSYRYAVWLQRPPTWRYFIQSLRILGRRLPAGVAMVGRLGLVDLVAQRFIWKRGTARGLGHLLLAWGCLLAFAVTFPLVFGWVHFELAPGRNDTYIVFLFGFEQTRFAIAGWMGFLLFNALNWSALLVVAGAMIMMRRRLTDAGQIAIQTFEGDWLPLLLLLAVSLTGLGITLDYRFMGGTAHQFMAITHAVTVILFLVWLPFGKFYHIIQRPAQLGVALYKAEGARGPAAVCPHTGEAFTSQLHIDDLKQVAAELGFDYGLKNGSSHLDRSPRGKRAAIAAAHLRARRTQGRYFG
jgi:hypothetical protein